MKKTLFLWIAAIAFAGWIPPSHAGSSDQESAQAQGADVRTVWLENTHDDHEFEATSVFPANYAPGEVQAAIVLVHGLGSWEEQSIRWMPMARALAGLGYVVLYPDARIMTPDLGASDLMFARKWLRDETDVERVGIISNSILPASRAPKLLRGLRPGLKQGVGAQLPSLLSLEWPLSISASPGARPGHVRAPSNPEISLCASWLLRSSRPLLRSRSSFPRPPPERSTHWVGNWSASTTA